MSYYDDHFDMKGAEERWTGADEPPEPASPPDGFHEAVRERRRGLVVLEGPKGSGKTLIGLMWSRILAGPHGQIAVIDTEHRRAALFAPVVGREAERDGPWYPPYDFWHLAWGGLYDPNRLVQIAERVAREVGPDGVVMVDSLSPFWSGRGGVQDIVDTQTGGWKIGGPVHRDMVDSLSRLPCHVVATIRSKTETVIEADSLGDRTRHTVRHIGTGIDQRLGIEFDFDVVVHLDSDHEASIRAAGFQSVGGWWGPEDLHKAALLYRQELGMGVERINSLQQQQIAEVFARITEQDDRVQLKDVWLSQFGAPPDLMTHRYAEAVLEAERVVAEYFDEPAPSAPEPEPEEPEVEAEPEVEPHEHGSDADADTCEICHPPEDGLDGQNREQLATILQTFGVDVDGRWSEQTLRAKIREAMAAVNPEPGTGDPGSDG